MMCSCGRDVLEPGSDLCAFCRCDFEEAQYNREQQTKYNQEQQEKYDSYLKEMFEGEGGNL